MDTDGSKRGAFRGMGTVGRFGFLSVISSVWKCNMNDKTEFIVEQHSGVSTAANLRCCVGVELIVWS